MDVSDECYHGDGPYLKRSIPKLCATYAPWVGCISYEMHSLRRWADFYSRIMAIMIVSTAVSFVLTFKHADTYAVYIMLFCSFGAVFYYKIKTMMHNRKVENRKRSVCANPKAILMDAQKVEQLFNNPLSGRFVIFPYPWFSHGYRGSEAFHRGDDTGSQITYMVFDDDTDRVLFRLETP